MPSKKDKKGSSKTKSDKSKKDASVKIETALPEAEFQQLSQIEMDALLDVLKRNKKQLMARKGVYKVDVGFRWKDGKMTGEVAIRVHVKEKKPEVELEAASIVPETLENFPVDVIESNIELHRRTRRNPLIGGVEAGNVNTGLVGTLGAVVYDATNFQQMALSNHHVFVDSRPNGAAGEQVNQPGTTNGNDAIGTVTRSNQAMDCAVATLNQTRQISNTIMDIPGGIKGVVTPVIGMRVMKSGRTTGTTFGMVEGASDNEVTIVPVPGEWQELSMGGDSGSIWLERLSHAALGLHYGGETSTAPEDERSWAKRITLVQNRLNIVVRRKAILGETSTNGAVITSKGNELLMSWTGKPNLLLNFIRSNDGLNFSGKVTLGETSPAAPALTVFGNRYVVAWIGVGNNQLNIMQSANGQAWTNKVTLGDTSVSSPSLAVFNGNLYIAWRGVGNNQLNVMRSSDGVNWRDKRTLGDTTTSGPSLTTLGSRLFIAWRGVGNNQLNVMRSSNGTTFSGKVTLGDTTTAKPYLHVHAGRAYLAWQGVGNRLLNVLESTNGTNWTNKITLRETCTDGPSIASLGNDFVWAWTGTDAQQRLNTLLYDLRA